MASVERGSAAATVGLVMMLAIAFLPSLSEANQYTVQWTIPFTWTPNKSLKAGDILLFQYTSGQHNVVPVNAAGYKNCQVPKKATTYKTGNDSLTLTTGTSYFICGFTGHCTGGMKLKVTAA